MDDILAALEVSADRGARLIEACAELSQQQLDLRRWKGTELTEALKVGSPQTIFAAEEAGHLPKADRRNGNPTGTRLGYTLDQMIGAMEHFGTRPGRKPGDKTSILSFTNFKGGCWKTTSCWYFCSWAAMQGYRVLAIDLDPQASLTRNMGIPPDLHTSYEDSLAPFIVELEESTYENVKKVIRRIPHSGVDLIPGTLDLQYVEWTLARKFIEINHEPIEEFEKHKKRVQCLTRVSEVISVVEDDYDIIVFDGTPTLGHLPLNIVLASDAVVVPVPTEMADFCSTNAFIRLLLDQYKDYRKYFGSDFPLTDLRYLPTRFAHGGLDDEEEGDKKKRSTSSTEILNNFIRPTFGDRVLSSVIRKHDAVMGRLGPYSRTVFEMTPGMGDIKRDSRMRATENFEQAFKEIMETLVYPNWPSVAQNRKLMEAING
ncbi:MAG: AAA family ATPase [Spongiibacteraceae bacterium]|nr:AAA family ATPase [Spongiibacteraceae bacterium]